MKEKKFRLNKHGTFVLNNETDKKIFDWTNDSDEIIDMLNKYYFESEYWRKLVIELVNINNSLEKRNESIIDYLEEKEEEYTEINLKTISKILKEHGYRIAVYRE